MNTHFVYPADMLKPRLPDEMFRQEAAAVQAEGHSISLLNPETFTLDLVLSQERVAPDVVFIYRGWMMAPSEYEIFVSSLEEQGAKPLTSSRQYLATHYLPLWYPLLADLTPETVVLDPDADLVPALRQLMWPRFFVKDYVKSLKTAGGSVVERPEDIGRVMAEMRKYRGMIEGGLCVRRYEEFCPESERRYFVINGVCYGPEPLSIIPTAVQECASRLSSPFFSVDVATRIDGVERIVEVGDGQVSDLVGWTAGRFATLWDGAEE